MDAHRGESDRTMCEVLGVSRSGYYAGEEASKPRDETNTKLRGRSGLHEESRRIYGSPRIYAAPHRGSPRRHRVAG